MNFPRLAADPWCFELPQRHDLMRCYGPLRRAILAKGTWPIIRNSSEAKQLAKLLQGMEKASAKHISRGGSVTGILVGRFDMSEWTGGLLRGPAAEFVLPCDLTETLGQSNAELPIRLALAPNSILIQVGEHQGSQTQIKTMIMDVKAASTKGALHYQQVNFQANGKLNITSSGVHYFHDFENGPSEDYSVEVLCALLVRDGKHNTWNSRVASSLQLDEPQGVPISCFESHI